MPTDGDPGRLGRARLGVLVVTSDPPPVDGLGDALIGLVRRPARIERAHRRLEAPIGPAGAPSDLATGA